PLGAVSTISGPEERGGRVAGGSGEAQAQGQPCDSAMAPMQPSLGPPRDEPRVFGLYKFNGDIFAEWSFKMENIFDHYDLLEVMEGTEKRPENDPEKSPWVRKSAQGYLLLGQALGSSQIRHIKPFQREPEKGPKAWAALKGVHSPTTAAVAVVLERQMAALRIEEDEAVEEGVRKFFDLLTQLEGADWNYSELQKKTKLLALLPESWSSLVINLNRDLPHLSLEDVKRAILQEDFRRRELASADGAGAASIGHANYCSLLVLRPSFRSLNQKKTSITVGAGGAGAAATGTGGARTRGTGAAGAGGVEGAGGGDPVEPGATGAGGSSAGAVGIGAAGGGVVDLGAGGAGDTVRPRPYFVPLLQQVLCVPSSSSLNPPLLCPPLDQSQLPFQPASPLPAPSPYTEQSGGLTKRLEPASRPVLPVRTARRVPRSCPPPVPGTHAMTLRPSSVPLRVPLPAPPESSLPEVPDLESDQAHVASPTVSRLLATAVTDPSFESAAASAVVAELLDFAAACCLNYASALVVKKERGMK
ncbi:unnamed protein product, partial [Closterium sp. NIES-54]